MNCLRESKLFHGSHLPTSQAGADLWRTIAPTNRQLLFDDCTAYAYRSSLPPNARTFPMTISNESHLQSDWSSNHSLASVVSHNQWRLYMVRQYVGQWKKVWFGDEQIKPIRTEPVLMLLFLCYFFDLMLHIFQNFHWQLKSDQEMPQRCISKETENVRQSVKKQTGLIVPWNYW